MSEREVLIRGGYVVTADPDLGELPDADVLVRGDRTVAVGPDLGRQATNARIVDAVGRLVLPGLVDTHRHVWLGALAASVGQASLPEYSTAVMAGYAPRYQPRDIYAGALWGALLALHAGITTVADWAHNLPSPAHADANLAALHDAGVRAVFYYGGPGVSGPRGEFAPAQAGEARRIQGELTGSALLRMGLALRGPLGASDEANLADFGLARELGLPISIHAGMSGFPHSVRHLDQLGLLGPDLNYAHGNHFTDREYDLIAASGGSISMSPSIDMGMAMGAYPATGDALARNIPAGLAVDTVAANGTDLFSEMRLALAAERSRANADRMAADELVTSVALGHRDMLRLATVDGARALRLDAEIGSLVPGKQADVTIVDLRAPHLDGLGDPVMSMVTGAGPADVETVLVAGELVKADGRLVGPYADRARALTHESRERIRAS